MLVPVESERFRTRAVCRSRVLADSRHNINLVNVVEQLVNTAPVAEPVELVGKDKERNDQVNVIVNRFSLLVAILFSSCNLRSTVVMYVSLWSLLVSHASDHIYIISQLRQR